MNMHPKPFPKALFITGIGTDVGKSYATGWLAKEIAATGKSVITTKTHTDGQPRRERRHRNPSAHHGNSDAKR